MVARRQGVVNIADTPPARSALAQLSSPTPATQSKNFYGLGFHSKWNPWPGSKTLYTRGRRSTDLGFRVLGCGNVLGARGGPYRFFFHGPTHYARRAWR